MEELKNEASHQLEAAQKKRDELIRQGENELEAARAKLVRWRSRWKVRLTP